MLDEERESLFMSMEQKCASALEAEILEGGIEDLEDAVLN